MRIAICDDDEKDISHIVKLITKYQIRRKMLWESPPLSRAYYCAYPSFVDIYHIIVRTMERSGRSVYLILCTVLDEKNLKKVSANLAEAIGETLRQGDTFTRYNMSQYLILLNYQVVSVANIPEDYGESFLK